MSESHYTKENEGRVGTITTPEEARKAHHLASADPEKDGLLTGPEHEEKYNLERAAESRALWDAAHERAEAGALETTEAPRASKSSK